MNNNNNVSRDIFCIAKVFQVFLELEKLTSSFFNKKRKKIHWLNKNYDTLSNTFRMQE